MKEDKHKGKKNTWLAAFWEYGLISLSFLTYQRDRVEAFVSKVNGAMRVRHELEKLQATADRIQNNYNVVEAVNEEMEKVTVPFFISIPHWEAKQ